MEKQNQLREEPPELPAIQLQTHSLYPIWPKQFAFFLYNSTVSVVSKPSNTGQCIVWVKTHLYSLSGKEKEYSRYISWWLIHPDIP